MLKLQIQTDAKKLNERGFASIVIALVMIIVMALITIGFAQLARREQRDALNKQLASQAYFAAESGINDTIKNLGAIQAAGSSVDPKQCLNTAQFSMNSTINQTNGVYYTCVLVNLKPPNIQYSNVAPGSERYILFSTEPGPLSSLTVHWGSADGKNTPRAASGFTPASEWGDSPAVLEVSLTPLPGATANHASLIANTFTVYMYPSGSAGGVSFNTANQGQVTSGGCSGAGAYPCAVTISNVPAGAGGQYLIRIIDHYNASNISITGQTASGQANFIGQPQIDVTGKAQEVLKRIQVRVPTRPAYELPKDVIESQSTCKRFTTDPTSSPNYDSALSQLCILSSGGAGSPSPPPSGPSGPPTDSD